MKLKPLVIIISAIFCINVFGLTKQTVSSVAEMTAITSGVDIIEIVGSNAGNTTYPDHTGSDGTFRWDATSIETEDGGTIYESDNGGTGRWKRVFDGKTFRVEWFGDPSATNIEKALNAGAKDIIIPPSDISYNWDKEITIETNVFIRTERDGEHVAKFNYYGPENGTMIKWNDGWGGMSGIFLNARQHASKVIHFGEDLISGSSVPVAFHLDFSNMEFSNAKTIGTQFGNYSVDEYDADICLVTFNNCRWTGNYRQIVYDSINAVNIVFINPQMTGGTSTIDIIRHIDMTRGGSATIISGHFGPMGASGNSGYPIYVKDGWIEIFGLQNESSTGGGGLIHMDKPTESYSYGHASELVRVRDLSAGASGTHKIYISNGANQLSVKSSKFLPRNGTISGSQLVKVESTSGNDIASKFISISNTYYTTGILPWAPDGATANIISIGDNMTSDGTNFMPITSYTDKRYQISTSPYNMTADGSLFDCILGSSTINLQSAYARTGRIVTIKNSRPYGGITVVPTSSSDNPGLSQETIDWSSSLNLRPSDSVTLCSDGYSNWAITSWVSSGEYVAASTGTATIKTGSANNASNAGWLQVAPGKYIPYWTDPTP